MRNFAASWGPEQAKNAENLAHWGPFWVKRPPTKFDRVQNADPVNPVCCPWGPSYGRLGGGGGHFVSWGPLFSVRGQTKKKPDKKNVAIFFPCGSNEPIFVENGAILAPGAPSRGPLGAALKRLDRFPVTGGGTQNPSSAYLLDQG